MRSSSDGFTLLELLCALTLSTLLMVAMLGVVGGLAKTEKTLDRHLPTPEWHRRLVAQIEQDLRAADELEVIPNGIRLTGFLGSDSKTGSSTWKKRNG